MPPRRSTRGSPSGNRIPAVFSGAMGNSAAANPNRRGRSPSPGTNRTLPVARRRLALGDANSPNRSNDGSGARSPCTGGGRRRPNVADQPDEDGPDNDFNPETFLNTLAASDQPMPKQFARILRPRTRPFLFCRNRSRTKGTSVRRRRPFATTKTQVDLDFAFTPRILAIYSTPLSPLTSVIWTMSDTTTISTWLPPSRKTCPKLSLWSSIFLRP